MNAAVALAAAAAVTYALRIALITVLPASRLPDVVRDSLRHVGPAVLAALVTASVYAAPGDEPIWPFLVATAAAVAVAARTRNVIATVAVGLTVVALLQPIAA